MKGMYEIWGEGTSYEQLEEAVNAYPEERKLPYLTSENTFKINIDSFGKTFTTQEQKELLKRLAFIPFKVYFTTLFSLVICISRSDA